MSKELSEKMLEAYSKPGETYVINVSRSGEEGVETLFLKEHELEPKHRDLLLGEAIRQYSRLPEQEQDRFWEHVMNEIEKEIKNDSNEIN